jgi:hypothetical protein
MIGCEPKIAVVALSIRMIEPPLLITNLFGKPQKNL